MKLLYILTHYHNTKIFFKILKFFFLIIIVVDNLYNLTERSKFLGVT